MGVDVPSLSIATTLIFNAAVGFVILLIFEWLRPKLPDIFAPRTRRKGNEMIPFPGNYPLSWLLRVWNTQDDDLIRISGMDAFVHVRFLKVCSIIFSICCILGAVVLYPTYATGSLVVDGNPIVGVDKISMSNLPQGSDKLWAAWVLIYLFTFLFLYMMYKEYENFARARAIYFKGGDPMIPKQMKYSVQVESIPPQFRSGPKLKELFDSLFPNEVEHSYVVTNLSPLDKIVQERNAVLAKLESAIAQFEASDRTERPLVSVKNGKASMCGGVKCDAIEFYKEQMSKLDEKLRRLQDQARRVQDGIFSGASPKNSGEFEEQNMIENGEATKVGSSESQISSDSKDSKDAKDSKTKAEKITKRSVSSTGFVTFKSRRSQVTAAQMPVLSEQFPTMTALSAPLPADIIWGNMGTVPKITQLVSVFTSIMYYVGLIFWATILSFIASISNLSALTKYLPFLKQLDTVSFSIIQGLFPVVVMIIFLALVPIFMTFIATTVEKRKTGTEVQKQVFQWYFMYQLANVYLLLLAGSVLNALADLIKDPLSIVNLISKSLPTTSIFFINFIITKVFLGIPLGYLRIGPLAVFTLLKSCLKEKKLTRRSLIEGPLANATVLYGTSLTDGLYILCIVLLYWVISPLILVTATCYFAFSYVAWKYQYIYVVVRQTDSGGEFWYGLFRNSMMALLFAIVTMVGYMGVKEGAVQSPLLAPLILIIILSWKYTESCFYQLSRNTPYSIAIDEDCGRHTSDEDEISQPFSDEYLHQPSAVAPLSLTPYPYRINGHPLVDEHGMLSPVYYDFAAEELMVNDKDVEKEVSEVNAA